MNIAIVWYWKMWQAVEKAALIKWEKISIIKKNNFNDLMNQDFDVIVDFSNPDSALENLQFYAENNFKVVMWTTWWHDDLELVKQLFKNSKWALIWSGNFSLGVMLYYQMLEKSAKVMNKFEDYDIQIKESHHKHKLDSPSGTALHMWEILIDNIGRKTNIQSDASCNRWIQGDKIHISSTRSWDIAWTHSTIFNSEFDSIELTHIATSRWWFAVWSLKCAEWLEDKQWYFEIEDFMKNL